MKFTNQIKTPEKVFLYTYWHSTIKRYKASIIITKEPFFCLPQTYDDVYEWFNCMEIGPCQGWMNSNASLRHYTTRRANQVSVMNRPSQWAGSGNNPMTICDKAKWCKSKHNILICVLSINVTECSGKWAVRWAEPLEHLICSLCLWIRLRL